ncbi:MAG: hypothetical protein ACI8ZN_001286 [Bacteroidia bacterium]|jgi:hypothetical protein
MDIWANLADENQSRQYNNREIKESGVSILLILNHPCNENPVK